MKMVTLGWGAGEEGTIKLFDDFIDSYDTLQLDAIGDWIYHLKVLQSMVANQKSLEHLRNKTVVSVMESVRDQYVKAKT